MGRHKKAAIPTAQGNNGTEAKKKDDFVLKRDLTEEERHKLLNNSELSADTILIPSVYREIFLDNYRYFLLSSGRISGKTSILVAMWWLYMNKYPDREPDPKLFTYPGPNPSTLEQAILMMADAVEAASRSLPEYTEESVSTLVEKIIDGQVKDGYFKMCPITFREIEIAKEVFKSKLKTIYHTRVQYPDEAKKAEEAATQG